MRLYLIFALVFLFLLVALSVMLAFFFISDIPARKKDLIDGYEKIMRSWDRDSWNGNCKNVMPDGQVRR